MLLSKIIKIATAPFLFLLLSLQILLFAQSIFLFFLFLIAVLSVMVLIYRLANDKSMAIGLYIDIRGALIHLEN